MHYFITYIPDPTRSILIVVLGAAFIMLCLYFIHLLMRDVKEDP